jgi:N-acyl-D-amino-acid deacylase
MRLCTVAAKRLIPGNSGTSRFSLLVWILMGAAFVTACTPTETGNEVASIDKPSKLIKNATIVDGTGAPGFSGNVRIEGNMIVAVGDFETSDEDMVIDGSGLILAPGFIDTHSHHDIGLDTSPEAIAAISQGITTIVVGNDGSSGHSMPELKQMLAENPPTVNVASYTGHGSIRSQVMGGDYKRNATKVEITEMETLLTEDLRNGSLGLSTGLEYDPGIYSNTEEVISLAKVTAAEGARYISHMRSEDRYFDNALEELIRIGREANLPVQISHFKLAAVDLWGQAPRVIQRLEQAREEGIDVTADVYPYTYWQSTLTVLLPERDFYDLDAARFALEKLAPAEGLTLVNYMPDPGLVGMTVAEIAAARGMSNEETYLALIRDVYEGMTDEEMTALDEPPEMVLGVSMSEDDIAVLIAWTHSNICSDGYGEGHPRGHGAFPRAIRQYVREQQILSIEEMIRKMTSLGAAHVGISDRGLVKQGYVADLVLFDPLTITDRATIENPKQLSEGIAGVWVNGDRVWSEQKATSARPGILISRVQAE